MAIDSEPHRMDEQPRHNHDMAHYQAEHHNVHPSYNCNSYHERYANFCLIYHCIVKL